MNIYPHCGGNSLRLASLSSCSSVVVAPGTEPEVMITVNIFLQLCLKTCTIYFVLNSDVICISRIGGYWPFRFHTFYLAGSSEWPRLALSLRQDSTLLPLALRKMRLEKNMWQKKRVQIGICMCPFWSTDKGSFNQCESDTVGITFPFPNCWVSETKGKYAFETWSLLAKYWRS